MSAATMTNDEQLLILTTWYIKRWDGDGLIVGPGHAVNEKSGKPACGCCHSDTTRWEMDVRPVDSVTFKRCKALLVEPQP